MTDAGTTDAGDPFPTCDGTPTFPTTGPLRFSAAMKTTFARACDAFGVCTPWKSEGDRIVLEDNGVWSRALSPDGGLSLNTQVGFSTLSDGYDCRDTDIGSGMVSLTTGLGEGSMTAGYRCNISGGSGGPYGTDPQRAVSLRYGASCMAVTDKLPTPTTNFGTQRRSVIILYR
jgi:hypothetical protein